MLPAGKEDAGVKLTVYRTENTDPYVNLAVEEYLTYACGEDEVILFADIVGGSPLSFAADVLAEKGLLGNTLMVGGMNLPLVLTTVLMKDTMDLEDIKEDILPDAADALKVFEVAVDDSADDDI